MIVLAEKQQITPRLHALGLDEPIVRDAVRAGELQRLSCTPFHPRSYGGYTAWGSAFAKLAEDLHQHGWRKEEVSNLPMIIEPTRRLALVVSSGNEFTGSSTWPPSTRYPKGSAFGVRVSFNQGLLFPDEPQFVPTPRPENLTTWLLLVRAEQLPKNHEIARHVTRCEVSLPSAIDPDGWVTSWAERIILEPITMDDVPLISPPSGWNGDSGVEVPVARR